MNTFAQYLENTKTTYADFAALTGIHTSFVSLLANGKRRPSDNTKMAIQRATNGAVSIMDWFPEQTNSPVNTLNQPTGK